VRLAVLGLPLPSISAFTRVFDALWGEGGGEGVTAALSSDCNALTPPLSLRGSETACSLQKIVPLFQSLDHSFNSFEATGEHLGSTFSGLEYYWLVFEPVITV
jgi:hypothetical protein